MADYHQELALLYRALDTPYGIAVSVSDKKRAQAHLYAARASSDDPGLDRLQIRTSPNAPDNEIWIVKGSEKDAET